MKKIITTLLMCVLVVSSLAVQTFAATTSSNISNDMRAVWISTIYNLDYPSSSNRNNIAAQKQEFIDKLNQLQGIGINTVIVQVRPKADALYQSSINPWSEVLTGTQGKDPGYDPLAFMIQEAHARGMELHAWLNPYRVTTSGTDVTALCATHPARLNPSWTFSYNNALYYNPEVEGVKQHIVDTVTEIAKNYDVDGIHFDDYFYPSSYPLPAGETRDGTVANARRAAVNDMIRRVSIAVNAVNGSYNKSVMFGVSPAGIWKNSSSDSTGSATSGNEAYYSVYADARTWIQNGWVDYIVPQIYWQTGHAKADYETLVKWWSNEVTGTNVKLYIGQGVYQDVVATQIGTQLGINSKYSQVKGSIFFSLRDILNNRMSCMDQIKAYYVGSSNTDTNNSAGSNSSSSSSSNSSSALSASAIGKTGIVTASSLNVRAGARTDRDVVAQLTKGSKVSIIGITGSWYKVKLSNGTVGWASGAYIGVEEQAANTVGSTVGSGTTTNSSAYPFKGTVTASTLNIRSGAKVERSVVKTVAQGTTLTVRAQLGNWYKVQLSDGTVGWANKAYIAD